MRWWSELEGRRERRKEGRGLEEGRRDGGAGAGRREEGKGLEEESRKGRRRRTTVQKTLVLAV
jgi:hypothetical protein